MLGLSGVQTGNGCNMDEYTAVTATLNAFYTFHKWEYDQVVKPKSIKYKLLSPEEQQLLPFYPELLSNLAQCIDINQAFTQSVALAAAEDWGVPPTPNEWAESSHADYDKVRSTLLQLGREWADDGAAEREKTFGRLLDKACALFPEQDRSAVRVLVPGCGLGRLVMEFVLRGFWTQGNEVSYHMLMALGFMLNRVTMAYSHTVFPYIHRLSHVSRRLYQLRPVAIPDTTAQAIFRGSEQQAERAGELMSMAAGLFVDLYGPPGLERNGSYTDDATAVEFRAENAASMDVVATCFFLDTASNVLDYLKTIRHVLKDGGVWLNMGPLHWHFEGDLTRQMITRGDEQIHTLMAGMELSRDELFAVMARLGLHVEESELGIETTYSSDVRAASNFVYGCEYWVARKGPLPETQGD